MAVVAAYMLNINLTSDEYEKIGTIDNGTIWMAAVSIILFMLCLKKLIESKTINNINQ